jgi:autotransporter translocation and assembly factor TamB
LRFAWRTTIALLVVVALAVAGAAVLYVTKDWLVAMGVRLGIETYSTRLNSTLTIQDVALDLFSLTTTVRGITIAERGHTALDAPIHIQQARVKIRLWPLIRRRVILEEVSVSEASVRLEIDRRNHVNLEELFRLLVDRNPGVPSPWNVVIHRFEAEQVAVSMALEDQSVRATLNSIAFQGSFILEPFHLHTELLHGQGQATYRLGQDRLRYPLLQTTAALDLFKNRLVIQQLWVGAEAFALTGQGGLENLREKANLAVAAQFTAELPLATVAPFIPNPSPLVGSIGVQGSIDGPLAHPQLHINAQGARIAVGPYVVSNLDSTMRLAAGRLQIERLALGFAEGTIQGTGELELAQRGFDIQVELADIALTHLLPLVGTTELVLDGHVAGHVRVVSPAFDVARMRAEGQMVLSPPAQPGTTAHPAPLFPLPLALSTRFRVEDRVLILEQTAWAVDGAHGELAGRLAVDGATQLSGALEADLAAPIFTPLGLPAARGEVKLTFGVRGHLPAPRVDADLQLQHASYQGLPVEHLRLVLEADQSELRVLSLSGTQWGAHYQLEATVKLAAPFHRLHRAQATFPIQSVAALRVQVEHLNLAKLPPWLWMPGPLAGELTLRAKGAGPWPEVRGEGQIDIRGLLVHGETLGDVSLMAEGSPTQVTLRRLLAEVGGGQMQASGSLRLPQPVVAVTVVWQGVHLERLASLQGMHLPVTGRLNGSVRAHGLWPDLKAEATVQGPQLTAYGLEVANLQLQATASPREVVLERFTTRIAGAPLTVAGRVTLGGPIDIRLSSEYLALRGFALLPQGFPLDGRVKLDLTGSGALESPQLRGQLQLTGVQAGGMRLGTGNLSFTLDGRRVAFSTAGLRGLSLNGSVVLDETLPATIHLGISSIDLGLLSSQLSGAFKGVLDGDASGAVEVSGQLRALPSLEGQITLERLRLRSNGVELHNSSPLRWQLARGVLRFEAVRLQAQGASCEVRGRVRLLEEQLDIVVSGDGPLAMVGTRIPGVRLQQGLVNTQLNIRGSFAKPIFDGRVLVQDGAMYIAAINETLSQLKGEIQFAEQTIAIQSLQGQLAGGRTEVFGEVRLRGFHLHEVSLTAQANQVRLQYPAGFSAVLDAEVVTSGNAELLRVTGEVGLARARYRQEIDLASLIRQYRQRALEPPAKAQESLQLDIRVSTRDPLRVENRLAKLQLAADLNVRGSPNRPVVLGRVEIDKGTADVAGSHFTAIAGSIDFLNSTRTEPFFDVAADTQKSGYQIHATATGTPRHIDLHLTSEPPLAENDILALLTVGATGQVLAAGVETVLPRRVSAFLTGQFAEEIGRGVGSLVGIDRLQIEPLVGGAQRVGGPKVTVGKDINKDFSVSYSIVVGSTQEHLVTIEYRLTDSISLLGIRDERGDVGGDVKFSLRFE